MNELKDFIIENGVLIKYTGNEENVVIPLGVVKVDKFAFEDSNVAEIILPSTVETISDVAFNETPNLQKLVVSEDNPTYCSINGCLYSKDNKRFICCPNRTEPLYIAEGCEIISSYAFFQRRVGKIVFPKTLKRFEHSALCNCCIVADELVIPNIEFENGEWFNATILPFIVKLEGMSALEDGAFAYSTFGAMSLPNTLTEIGDWAFYNCNMNRIYIPKTVKSLGENVFAIECPVEPVGVEEGDSEEYSWYDDEEQDGELEGATVDPVEAFLPCPIGFLLGVDDEECAAAQYAKANSIPYQIVTDIEMFLIADSSDEKEEINDLNKGDFF
jgi:hypothetical protein